MKKAYKGNLESFAAIAKNLMRDSLRPEMSRKVLVRLWGQRRQKREAPEAAKWCESVASDVAEFCASLDSALWEEAKLESARIHAAAEATLQRVAIDFGSPGHVPLLYFLVRYLKPQAVVETGVAVGFSSNTVLHALRDNGFGRLYSSDFPYFRLEDAEKYIGLVVPQELRKDWVLLTRGDRKNLPEILDRIGDIQLFHYDSDKFYSGREWALDLVKGRMKTGSVVVMDDVSDNLFFHDYVSKNNLRAFVFAFKGKYTGLFIVP